MKILQWNLNGFYPRLERLQKLIASHQPDIICIQETNFKLGQCGHIRGYLPFNKNRANYSHASGGVATYIKSNIPVNYLQLETEFEAVAVTIEVPTKITICNLYLPNSQQFSRIHLESLTKQIHTPFIILGDFNSHHQMWGCSTTNQRGSAIEEWIELHENLTLLNNGQPTHFSISTSTESAIDLTITSSDLAPGLSWMALEDPHDSDHFPIFIESTSPSLSHPFLRTNPWNYKKANWSTYREKIRNGLMDLPEISNSSSPPINNLLQAFNELILSAASLSIPQ